MRAARRGAPAALARGAAVALSACAGAAALTACGGEHRTPSAVNVLPFPDTPDASPQSQITFPALPARELKSLAVTGSRSGRHAGQVSPLPGGRGVAFAPAHPFVAGEQVSVQARLRSSAAGTEVGAVHADRVGFQFSVATPSGQAGSKPAARSNPAAGHSHRQPAPAVQHFHSRPDLRPPAVSVLTRDADERSGDVFMDAQLATQNGPMILDSQGRLVWFHPLPAHQLALDVRAQAYEGHPVLTYWQGRFVVSYGFGQDTILDSSYRAVATVRATEGYQADLHEFQLTPRGTALITIYQPTRADLSSVGGSRQGSVVDGLVQEIDVRTGRLLWEWHALGHVPLTATYQSKPKPGTPYDYFHINSIKELPGGDLLISARNTWAAYRVSRTTGKVVWQLGGKGSSFHMGAGTVFAWQHDAVMHGNGTLTMFDNEAIPRIQRQSRAITVRLDTGPMRASLLRSYTHTPSRLAGSQGSMQILANGNVFVGWGSRPYFTEYTPGGRVIFDGQFSESTQSYRAYRAVWQGRPAGRPAVAVEAPSANGASTVFASWNGATEIARWQLLAGPDSQHLTSTAATASTGFETAVTTTTTQPYLAVRALAGSGQVLGTSGVVRR